MLSNKKDAKVHERSKRLKVSSLSFNRDDFYASGKVLNLLKEKGSRLPI